MTSSDNRGRYPAYIVYSLLGVVSVCILPAILNLLGIDFASEVTPLAGQSVIDGVIKADDLFFALSGALHHALLEWSAVSVAVLAMVAAFIHYSVRKDVTVPIIGVALLCAGLVDAFHTLAATRIIDAQAPNTDFIPFTWALSRSFNAGIMIAGVIIALWISRAQRPVGTGRGLTTIGLVSLVFVGIAYAVVNSAAGSASLPQTMYPGALITRPFDVLPLTLFIVAGALFWTWLRSNPTPVKFALLLSTLPEIATQIYMAFGSTALFDNHFNIAHTLKLVSYLVVFVGMLVDFATVTVPTRAAGVRKGKDTQPIARQDAFEIGKAKYPLAIKIPAAVFILTAFVSIIVGTGYHAENQRVVVEREMSKLEQQAKLFDPLLDNFFNEARGDAVFLSRTPPIAGIVAATRNLDKQQHDSWVSILEKTLSAALDSKLEYLKIRFLNVADGGFELVGAKRTRSSKIVLTGLGQQAQDLAIFDEVSQLARGEVYMSPVGLYREQQELAMPVIPSVSVATPIYDELSGQVFGMLVIDINYEPMLEALRQATPQNSVLYLANANGDYLLHPSDSKTFGFEYGDSHLMQAEFSGLLSAEIKGSGTYVTDTLENSAGLSLLAVYRRLQVGEFGLRDPLRMLLVTDDTQYLKNIESLNLRGLALALSLSLISLAIAVVGSRRITAPLSRMAQSVKQYELSGQLGSLPVGANDEIGVLARAYHNVLGVANERTQDANRSAARMQAIVDTAADGIISIDANGLIQSFNRAAESTFGYTESEVLDKNVNMLMPAPFHQNHDQYVASYLETGEAKIIGTMREVAGLRKNGQTFPLELAVSEVKLQGARLFTGIVRDISLRKEIEEDLRQSNAELEEFAYRTSHDLRSPVISSVSLLGMAKKYITDNDQDKALASLSHAHNSLSKLEILIRDILTLIEAKNKDEVSQEVDIVEVVDEALAKMAHMDNFERLDIRTQFQFDEPLCVKKTRLTMIVENLISNAIKYQDTAEQNSHITISTRNSDGNFVLQVQDNGLGIPADQHDKLFTMFKRFHPKTSFGSGLGLYLMKKSADVLRGNIAFLPSQEETTFRLSIPI